MIRYKPGEAVRWLSMGAQELRDKAKRQGKSFVGREGERSVRKDFKDVAGALFDLGKSALADLSHRQALASEYLLHSDRFEIVASSRITSIRYEQIKALRLKHDTLKVLLENDSVSIKPHAYIVSGRIKVPVGWVRNDMEVPYETILDELSGRSGVNIEHL